MCENYTIHYGRLFIIPHTVTQYRSTSDASSVNFSSSAGPFLQVMINLTSEIWILLRRVKERRNSMFTVIWFESMILETSLDQQYRMLGTYNMYWGNLLEKSIFSSIFLVFTVASWLLTNTYWSPDVQPFLVINWDKSLSEKCILLY